MKIKNREYWRYELEREGAIAAAKQRRSVIVWISRGYPASDHTELA